MIKGEGGERGSSRLPPFALIVLKVQSRYGEIEESSQSAVEVRFAMQYGKMSTASKSSRCEGCPVKAARRVVP